MNIKKTEIVICLGSSCFARGNKKIVNIIKGFISENNLSEIVYFHGAHCFGDCHQGPTIKINDKFINNVSESNVVKILKDHFSI